MRRFLIAGNWKMNLGPVAASALIRELRETISEIPGEVDVLVCPPFVSIPAVYTELEDYSGVFLGAQNIYFEDSGAYTGEVSASMLKEAGCSYVIVGHSERREYFGETDEWVNRKTRRAISAGLYPVICVGESLEQRKQERQKEVVRQQMQKAFENIPVEEAAKTVIAYEPVWAIGTGETASPDQAQQMHRMIRSEMEEKYGEELARSIRILYGGSMKPSNAEGLLDRPDVDGGLVGGASLKADQFAGIIETAEKLSQD